MGRFCLLIFVIVLLLDLNQLAAEENTRTTAENAGGVFVSPQTANAVLRRQRRYNSPLEELVKKDNLERECREELCSFEEAREVFENDEKTLEFWAGYIDGDQCDPNPCQNGGDCKDGVSSYVCWCPPNFSGKNCEIEVAKQCTVNNGECSHFCVMRKNRAVCQCAVGYSLGSDRKSCQPTVPFSCGRLDMPSSSNTKFALSPRSFNSTLPGRNSSFDFQDYDEDDISALYDYWSAAGNDSDRFNTPSNSTGDVGSVKSDVDATETPSGGVAGGRTARSAEEAPTEQEEREVFSWAFPQLPNVTAEKNSDQRIVGGFEAKPGEIPWQVTLMSHSASLGRAESFCGGSLLSELWVITAAHCVVPESIGQRKYFVRVGEHDVDVSESEERDHEVEQVHLHTSYNYRKSQYNHDIALLRLASPVELSNQRRPICLGPKDFTENLLQESKSSMVSGWGQIKFQGRQASKLQKLQVPYVDRITCQQSSRDKVTRFMFCAGYQSLLQDACQGDSGGPHATNYNGTWFLTGIVSWGEECAKDGKYGIYTRVSMYYPWISKTTGLHH